MSGLLEGKNAIVFGAGSRVGRASSLRFAEEGAQVVCADDTAAHHLVWHFVPVGLLALWSLAAGTSLFGWSRRRLL